MRKWLDMAVEILTVSIVVLIGITVLGMGANSPWADRLATVPVAGPLFDGVRSVIDGVYHPAA